MERKTSFSPLSKNFLAPCLICGAILIPGLAVAADSGNSRDAITNLLVAVETQFSDGSSQRGQAFAVANHLGGLVAVTANSVVRSQQQQPNPTRAISATLRREGFDQPKTASISLAELHDLRMNLALLFSPGDKNDDWPETACDVSELPSGSEVTTLRRDGTTGELDSIVGRVLRGFEGGRAVVQISKLTERVDELMGAPVLIEDKFVGMVVEQRITETDVSLLLISATDIARFLATYLIRMEFQPSVDCAYKVFPFGKSVNELRRRVKELLAAQRIWSDVQNSFAATETDLAAMFGAANAERAKKEMQDHVSNLSQESAPGPPPINDGIMTECYEITASVLETLRTPFDLPIKLDPKPGRLICSINWESKESGELYALPCQFLFINGHWVWLC